MCVCARHHGPWANAGAVASPLTVAFVVLSLPSSAGKAHGTSHPAPVTPVFRPDKRGRDEQGLYRRAPATVPQGRSRVRAAPARQGAARSRSEGGRRRALPMEPGSDSRGGAAAAGGLGPEGLTGLPRGLGFPAGGEAVSEAPGEGFGWEAAA